MRVAFVTHQFFPAYYTGVERLTLNLASQLGLMGHECVVVTPADYASGSVEPYAVKRVSVRPFDAGPSSLAHPWELDAEAVGRFGRILDEEDVDLVHVMQPMRVPYALDEAQRRGLRVVVHLADFWHVCPRITLVRPDASVCSDAGGGRNCAELCGISAGPERLRWCRELLERADAVVSPARSTIDFFATQGFETARWHHVPWGVDYAVHREAPRPSRQEFVVGFIGTLVPHKGVSTVIEAARRVDAPQLRVRIYGGSFHAADHERELRSAAAGDSRIAFMGSYRHEDFPSVLAELDAVVIPSLWRENLPTTGLNAIAARVPIIVSDGEGLTELIDDYGCGFAYPMGNAEALAAILRDCIARPELLDRVRRDMLYPPSLEEEAVEMEQIYNRLREPQPLRDESAARRPLEHA